VVAIGDPTNFENFSDISHPAAAGSMKKRRWMVAFVSFISAGPGPLTAGLAQADREDVGIQDAASHRTAWLFTRGDSSVTMSVNEDKSGLALVVLGPGAASATYRFTQKTALTAFAEAQEQKLLDEGFQLQAVAERRSGRRGSRPGGPERRRS
jgi:hypothetical protein